jgi:hypothetical protein
MFDPMPLQQWINEHPIPTEMFWKSPGENQLKFMRDTIAPMFNKDGTINVISEHRSKSIDLPVYSVSARFAGNNGFIALTFRGNFYDWKVSIDSNIDIDADFKDLFNQDNEIHPCYCEGFPESLIFSPYSKDHKQFTVELYNSYKVYVFCWLITRTLKISTRW